MALAALSGGTTGDLVRFKSPAHARESGRRELIKLTGVDFGYDVARWRAFLTKNRKWIYKPLRKLTLKEKHLDDQRLHIAVELLQTMSIGRTEDRARASKKLTQWTGQNFGRDLQLWEDWFCANLTSLPQKPKRLARKRKVIP
jgi:transposase